MTVADTDTPDSDTPTPITEHWFVSHWRPAMAWLYMGINACDFIIFPALTMLLSAKTNVPYVPWKSITLDNGGIIHLAFGAILGISAWSRGQERIRGVVGNGG
jgi:hypothetical protein